MLNDQISEALERAADVQPYVPDAGEALRRGKKLRSRRRNLAVAGSVLAVVAIVAGIVVALPASRSQTATVSPAPATTAPSTTVTPPSSPRTLADPSLVKQVTTLPAALFSAVKPSSLIGLMKVDGTRLTDGGKPVVFWDGAEYCPYCAIERWPLVVALSRFGSWSSLSTTTSSSSDTPASLATFTFYGASYSSPYIAFQSVETMTNRPVGNGYQPLQSPTPEQSALVNRYDHGGGIPFIDFGNTFTLIGASYDYSILQGKSVSQIAAELSDTTTAVSENVLGVANQMTAAICTLTGDQPTSVCDSVPITALRESIRR